MSKIFLWCVPTPYYGYHDVIGYALAEDGTALASHVSSDKDWSKHDMGFTSNWKHEDYKEHYPDGFELVWIEDFSDEEFSKALLINQQKGKINGGKET